MPTITLNKKVFEKLIGKKMPIEQLKEKISFLGTDLEKIEGNEIVVEVFPNRPDMLSEQGFARAFSSFIGKRTGLRKYIAKKSNYKVIIDKSVKTVRPFTACAVVKGINFDDEKIKEVIQIQEKLHVTYGRNRKKAAIGIYPFEKIKLPIKYEARKHDEIRFQPLDTTEIMTVKQILTKHPAGREYAHLLEGLTAFPIFIDSNNAILSMPPIINSEKVGKITTKTKDVFIECSGFDFEILSKCLNIIVTALADMGGQIFEMELIYDRKKINTPQLVPEEMKIDRNYVNNLLGLELDETHMKRCLLKMGYDYKAGKAFVPCYRADILHPVDLVEDIAIAYGYDKFKEEIPKAATIGQEDKFEVFKRRIAETLIGLDLIETNTYNLMNKEHLTTQMNVNVDYIELENPKNVKYNALRSWMIPSLLQVIKSNKHHEFPQKIFEMGTIFKRAPKEETGIKEMDRLGVVISGNKANYTVIRQVLDSLFAAMNLEYSIEETEHGSFIPGRVARVGVKGKGVAYIGEIHPEVIDNLAIEMPIAAFELNLTDLYNLINS
ncbi:MAG: phenylalanine--tRNA ligase subunit beta [Nanoarchaeota archaeon]|nr:phenylalanine--tRNA ligase subunit beta [Nanoarchaeota archaeon]MCG2717259.1 phenylalanine--tRNA ligase subunit beta [Nanoarchaeota archaeon]